MVEPRMHAVAVIFDFVEPLIAIWRHVDQLGELRQDPLRQRGRIVMSACYGSRHAGSVDRLRCRRMLS
jgi:hypothetical protein